MAKHRDERPLLWTGLRGKDNVVVLTERAVYIARLSVQELAQVNAAFEAGRQPEDVLTKGRRVRLERILAYEYQHSPLQPLAALTLIHGQPEARKRTVLPFAVQAERDKFKVELQARLSLEPWQPAESLQHPGPVILKYLAIIAGLAIATALLAMAEWKGGDHGFLAFVIVCGGAFACLIAAGMGHREVRFPLMTICHAPEPASEDDLPAETPRDGDHDQA